LDPRLTDDDVANLGVVMQIVAGAVIRAGVSAPVTVEMPLDGEDDLSS
jgi:hypothetical protein